LRSPPPGSYDLSWELQPGISGVQDCAVDYGELGTWSYCKAPVVPRSMGSSTDGLELRIIVGEGVIGSGLES
jgi:hypothetical protein